MALLDDPIAPEAVRSAYPDCPSVGRLLTEAAAEYGWALEADLHPTAWRTPAYTRQRHRTYLLLRGAALDVVALQSADDLHSAAQAAQAGNGLRGCDALRAVDAHAARAYLREQYTAWRSGARHPWDCPGGCAVDGTVLETLTWEDQGDGIYVAVHQEPVDCLRGEDAPEHGSDCASCRGTGHTREPGYRHRCLNYQPQPSPDPADPWAQQASGGWGDWYDEPPF